MLTGDEILRRVQSGSIEIMPFNERQLQPNSYDVRLHENLYRIHLPEDGVIDLAAPVQFDKVVWKVDRHGRKSIVLEPNRLYLGVTEEWFNLDSYTATYQGRSTTGRYGLQSHLTAGGGDVGFQGRWTLELLSPHPLRIYAGMRIGQVYFHEVTGDTSIKYGGGYSNGRDDEPMPLFPRAGNF